MSAAGAALAGGMTIDAHDGHKLTKGHVGCGVIPTVLALMEAEKIQGLIASSPKQPAWRLSSRPCTRQ